MFRTFKRPESVLVVVFTSAGEVLLIERTQPAGYWQSVTGSLEWDEIDPLVAAERELAEETGLRDVPVRRTGRVNRFAIQPSWRHRYAADASENTEHVFAVELPASVPVVLDPAEHVAAAWFAREDAAARVFSCTNRDAILALVPSARRVR